MGTLEMAAPKQHDTRRIDFSTEEATMAKGQNRSSREPKTRCNTYFIFKREA
jgi:hypothetical protein